MSAVQGGSVPRRPERRQTNAVAERFVRTRPLGMPRLAADPQWAPSRACPSRLRRPLQPPEAAPCARSPATEPTSRSPATGVGRHPPPRPARRPHPRVPPSGRMTPTPILVPLRSPSKRLPKPGRVDSGAAVELLSDLQQRTKVHRNSQRGVGERCGVGQVADV
jgi:hypothetical protein